LEPFECLDGWMDEWIDRWMDRTMDVRSIMDGLIVKAMAFGWMDGWLEQWMLDR